MMRDGFLRFCDNPEIACCKAERELEQLRAENASLLAQLAESQRREQAAVEDFEGCMKNKKERCAYCIHDDECEPGESLCYANVCGFEWRGPQEAGKGDAE